MSVWQQQEIKAEKTYLFNKEGVYISIELLNKLH